MGAGTGGGRASYVGGLGGGGVVLVLVNVVRPAAGGGGGGDGVDGWLLRCVTFSGGRVAWRGRSYRVGLGRGGGEGEVRMEGGDAALRRQLLRLAQCLSLDVPTFGPHRSPHEVHGDEDKDEEG